MESHSLRKRNKVNLIGFINNQIVGGKLPSNRQALSVLFYNLRVSKLNLKESATLVAKEVLIFWEKARIPTIRIDHCAAKVISLHKEWNDLQKRLKRVSDVETQKRAKFEDKLDNLFDVAVENVLNILKNKEDIQFLVLQRKKGRPGYMSGIDLKLTSREDRKRKRIEQEEERRKRASAEMERNVNVQLPLSSSESADENSETETRDTLSDSEASTSLRRGTLDFFTPRLSEAFDKCKISDRNAIHLLVAAAEAFKFDTTDLIINRTSIQRRRKEFRDERQAEIKRNFNLHECKALVLHWDSKLLPAVSGMEKSDRLAVIVTFEGKEQILGIPEIPASTGKDQAMAVFETVENWGIEEKIQALCFDTTASNTGRINGACSNLENLLQRDLLYLPCRHHIFEVVLKGIYDTVMGPTSGPDVTIFKRFKECWSTIESTKYHIDVDVVSDDVRHNIMNFLVEQLTLKQPRDDYRELLELSVIFLGGTPPRGVSFRIPGPVSHARWMAKAIYALKIYLFQNQFNITTREKDSIRRICIFIVRIYLRSWFLAPLCAKAPYLDFNFLLNIIEYKNVDADISNAAVKKFAKHLWYLAPETAAFAFFDDDVPLDIKHKMAIKMKTVEDTDYESPVKRFIIKQEEFHVLKEKDLSYFITSESNAMFSRFKISMNFMNKSPSTWREDENYQRGMKILNSLVVVNDVAERGVKLIQEYNNILSKDETEKQYIIQIVSEYRKRYPDSSKSTLSK